MEGNRDANRGDTDFDVAPLNTVISMETLDWETRVLGIVITLCKGTRSTQSGGRHVGV